MTREEAIRCFEKLLLHVDTNAVMGTETTEAINMAIKALEQPECEDAVSRKAVLGCLFSTMESYHIRRNVLDLPPAQPEHDENDLDFVQPHKRIPVQLVVSSDTISREDAIECLERLSACDEPFVEIGTDDETFIGRYEAITEISDLPPAQPYTEAEIQKMQDLYQAEIDKAFELGQEDARSEIIHCGDCKYYHASYCEVWSRFGTIQTRENGFCYMAERKEGE